MARAKTILAIVADEGGQVFEHPELSMAGMNGMTPRRPRPDELIPLPEGSRLFTIPDTPPVGLDRLTGQAVTAQELPGRLGGGRIQAVSAFLTPGFTRTLLPAADYSRKSVQLPLWSYTAVGWCAEEERFYCAAVRVDDNYQWHPDRFDDRRLDPLVRRALRQAPGNRLLEQLARCAVDYHCFAAKNLFFRRWEAPLPTSPSCNSRCLGCISLQESDCCPASQERLNFVPTVEEICALAVPHLREAENAIVSFGQGCEGDPILQADTVSRAVSEMRRQTSRGTINFNTNASLPEAVDQLADAGIDSIRISLNSAQEHLYNSYYRPQGYEFSDVVESMRRAERKGLFTMLNYLVFPGITDREDEVEALISLVEEHGIELIQLRNLSIDPAFYWQATGGHGEGMGMRRMMKKVLARVPQMRFGYFNRTREQFTKNGRASETLPPRILTTDNQSDHASLAPMGGGLLNPRKEG
jgi:molybdenum cofactor biosynthesis enzyme MoaA